MTQQEYQKLLNSSPTFRGYTAAEKQEILTATGAKRDSYIQIFQEEIADRHLAAEQYVTRNEEIIRNYGYQAKNQQVQAAHQKETAQSQQELDSAEQLLKNL